MSVRAKTGRRRRVHRHVSLLLLITFGIQSGAVAQAPPPLLPPTPAYRVSNPLPGLRPVLQDAGADGHEAPDDPTAPTLTVSAVRTLLWPPNHEMWAFRLGFQVKGSELSVPASSGLRSDDDRAYWPASNHPTMQTAGTFLMPWHPFRRVWTSASGRRRHRPFRTRAHSEH